MKKLFIYIFLLVAGNTLAQTDTLEIHFFKSGKLSSIQTLEGNRFGKAVAYNELGEIIFEQSIRRIGGHASVYFSYFDHGGIKKADYSSAPDGGIQWYKSYSEFNKKGERINFYEMSNDQLTHPFPMPNTYPTTVLPTPKVVFIKNEIIIANETSHTLILEIKKSGKNETVILQKKKVYRVEDIFSSSESDFESKFSFIYSVPNLKTSKKVKLVTLVLEEENDKQLRMFTFKK